MRSTFLTKPDFLQVFWKHRLISLNPAGYFSAKRNFPLTKNYSDISKIWNVKNQDFPLRQLGNCLQTFFPPRLLLFAKKSEEGIFFSDVKNMFPTSVPLCFSILYFVWVLVKQGFKSENRSYKNAKLHLLINPAAPGKEAIHWILC